MCQCGCRGWCTWFPLLLVLARDLVLCSSGDSSLAFVLAILEFRADWPAWCELLGVRNWRHALAPCPKCDICFENMLQPSQVNSKITENYTAQQYLQDVQKAKLAPMLCGRRFCDTCFFVWLDCSVWRYYSYIAAWPHVLTQVVLIDTEENQRCILELLVYRKDCRGRAMSKAIPHLHLRKWDRLTPSPALLNVANFESMKIPFLATFWRITKHDRVVHDCPILELQHTAGFSYSDWVIDLLHSWALGPLGALVSKTLMVCVKSGVFSPKSAFLTSEDVDRLALLHIKSLCTEHYTRKRQTDSRWRASGTEVWGSQGHYKERKDLMRSF